MRAVAEKYQIIQVGICFFVRDTEKAKTTPGTHYLAYPFNMFIFPEERLGSRTDVLFDIDCVNFHKQQKLDFNKWIYEGVPYVNLRTEKMLTQRATDEWNNENEVLNITEDDAKKIAVYLEAIRKWISEGAKGEHIMADLNPFLRKCMYQKLTELFPALYYESRQVSKFEKHIVLRMVTDEEKKAIKETKKQEDLKEVSRKSGALRIFKLLTQMKVPIIGHNPTYDLMFIYSHFCEELPHSLADFKGQINSMFPIIYDTMLVFSDEKVKKLLPDKQSSALEAVYQFLSKSAEMQSISLSVDLPNKYAENGHYHEAGYDAYITGYCFAKMMGYIDPKEFEKYKNQLYAHRSPFNINLVGREALHDNTLIYVGKISEGKNIDTLCERLKEFKDMFYTKIFDADMVLFTIKKAEYF